MGLPAREALVLLADLVGGLVGMDGTVSLLVVSLGRTTGNRGWLITATVPDVAADHR